MSFDRDQPRDDHGRFSGGDWAERRAGKLAGALTNKADKEGGFSYRTGGAKEDRVPKTGFMVPPQSPSSTALPSEEDRG